MPFLVKKIEISIVEQNTANLSVVSSLSTEIGYGGIYFSVSNFIGITQNFDYVISSEDFPNIKFYGLKNNEYQELKISY